MTNLEKLKNDKFKAYVKFKKLNNSLKNIKSLIRISLNRIELAYDDEEVEHYYCDLLDRLYEYKERSLECHKQSLVYDSLYNEYLKEIDNEK